MKFSVNQQDLQKSLGYCQGVIEKRSTLPILSNVLLEINNGHCLSRVTHLIGLEEYFFFQLHLGNNLRTFEDLVG